MGDPGTELGRAFTEAVLGFGQAAEEKRRRKKEKKEETYLDFIREAQRQKTETELADLSRLTQAKEDVFSPAVEPSAQALFQPGTLPRSDRFQHALTVLSGTMGAESYENLARQLGIKTPQQEELERKETLRQVDRQKAADLEKIAGNIGARKMSLREVRDIETILRSFNDQALAGNLRETFKPFYPSEAKPEKTQEEKFAEKASMPISVADIEAEQKDLTEARRKEIKREFEAIPEEKRPVETVAEFAEPAPATKKEAFQSIKRKRTIYRPEEEVGPVPGAPPQTSTRESVLAIDPTAFPGFEVARQFYKAAWDEGKISQQEYQKFYGFIKGHYKKP